MSSIRIDWAGPATSVQDIGRFGAQRYGLGTAGAMDRMGLARANALVGQEAGMAALEIGPLPLKLTVLEGPVLFGLSGGERTITLNSGPSPLRAVSAPKRATVSPFQRPAVVSSAISPLRGGLSARPSSARFLCCIAPKSAAPCRVPCLP